MTIQEPGQDTGGAGGAGVSPPERGDHPTEVEVDLASESGHVDFRCTNCGASMVWNPEVDALSCDYCGNVVPVPRGEGLILERPLESTENLPRGLGRELRVIGCRECGAKVALEGSSTSTVCVYCGSSSVLSQEANRNALRPESVVPLDLTEKQVREGFREWARGLWFRPNALKSVDRLQAVGIYVPFWTYDCKVHSAWSADSGTYYYVMVPTVVIINGKPQTQMRQERRVRWRPSWGERDDGYDDVLVSGSRGLPAEDLRRLGGFDIEALVPYRPEYLAGWRAEEYEVDLSQAWEQAQLRVEQSQRDRCAGDVPGDTYRNLQVRNAIRDVRWKHILLPIWSLQYRFGSKTYTVLVHGQTGRVVGRAPYSFWKIAAVVLLVGGLLLAFLLAR